jgi:hypothetical protein
MSSPYQYQRIQTGNSFIDRIQANIQNAFNSIVGLFLGGNNITGVSLSANTPLAINHGLGRVPQIWTLTDISASASVYRTAWTSTTITLESSADCSVNFWVN